jgi:hypothetical protein
MLGHEPDDIPSEDIPADRDGLSTRWLRRQFGWFKQGDHLFIPLDPDHDADYGIWLTYLDSLASGELYYLQGGGSSPGVYLRTASQMRGLLRLYGIAEK